MSQRLDDHLTALRASQSVLAPDDLEDAVWRRVQRIEDARSMSVALLPIRAAAVFTALGIGVVGGGLTAAAVAGEPNEISAFSIHSSYAPSTLLDRHK